VQARRLRPGDRQVRRRLRCRHQDARALPGRPSELTSRDAVRQEIDT
jgi:hypothetical protein